LIAQAQDAGKFSYREQEERHQARLAEDEERRQETKAKKLAEEEAKKKKIAGQRWDIVVTDVVASRHGTGLDGRGTKSVGLRYGVPSQERKRHQVKIPTKVVV
jgi:hypothetical protein